MDRQDLGTVTRRIFRAAFGAVALGCGFLPLAKADSTPPKAKQLSAEERLEQALKRYGGVSQKFFTSHTLPLKIPAFSLTEVVYGAESVGFWSTKDYQITKDKEKKDQLQVNLLPPSYRQKVLFFVKDKAGKWHKLGAHRFSSPLPAGMTRPLLPINKLGGAFKTPFILLNGAIEPSGNPNPTKALLAQAAYILSGVGEIIWMHFPDSGKRRCLRRLVVRKVTAETFGVMCGKREGYFELVNLKGKVLRAIEPLKAQNPYVISHDFWVAEDLKSMLTFGLTAGSYEDQSRKKKAASAKSPEDPNQQILDLGPLRVTASTLNQVDLVNNKAERVFDPFDHFDPNVARDMWSNHPLLFPEVTFSDYARFFTNPRTWAGPGRKPAHKEWAKATALDYRKGAGYLINYRNLDQIVVLDDQFKPQWSVGPNPGSLYRLYDPNDLFAGQAYATWVSRESMLVFNNRSAARFKSEEDNTSKVAIYRKPPQIPGVIKVWEFVPEPHYLAETHGSAELQFREKVVVALFSSVGKRKSVLVEIDLDRKTERASMVFNHGQHWSAYRGLPFFQLGQEKFLGKTFNVVD